MKHLRYLLLGAYFGLVLTKSEVVTWHKIRAMFYFREPDLYLIIGSAVAVGASLLWLIRRRNNLKTPFGEQVEILPTPMHKGVFYGGFLFGFGWFIAGTCPGPIYAQLGGGEFFAVFTLAGAVTGAYAFAALQSRLPD